MLVRRNKENAAVNVAALKQEDTFLNIKPSAKDGYYRQMTVQTEAKLKNDMLEFYNVLKSNTSIDQINNLFVDLTVRENIIYTGNMLYSAIELVLKEGIIDINESYPNKYIFISKKDEKNTTLVGKKDSRGIAQHFIDIFTSLSNIKQAPKSDIPVVKVNSIVRYTFLGGNDEKVVKIIDVNSKATQSEIFTLSRDKPFAKAILGHPVGKVVEFNNKSIEITAIE